MKFRFPVVIIDEDYRSENASGLGIRALARAIEAEGMEVWIDAHASLDGKCVRCWHYRADVGAHAEHPELCGRCVSNVAGPGEPRQWF